jgi:hypothetical protein
MATQPELLDVATEHDPPKLTRRKHGRGGWSYKIDGEPIQSVTKIIGEGVPKPALQSWAAREVARCVVERRRVVLSELSDEEVYDFLRGAPFRSRDAAANRGTEVHRLAQALVSGEQVQPPPEIAGHVEAYAEFLEAWQIGDALVERPCFHLGLKYGGTFDLLATSPRIGFRPALWDIKTSGSGVYGEVALQMAGYLNSQVYLSEDGEQHLMERVERCFVVWVTERGYDVFEVAVTDEDWLTFRAAARVAWWRQYRMEHVVGESLWTSQAVRP